MLASLLALCCLLALPAAPVSGPSLRAVQEPETAPDQAPGAAPAASPKEHPQEREARAIAAALEEFLGDKKQRMKTRKSKSGRVRIHADSRSSGAASKGLKAVDKVLGEFDVLLGAHRQPADGAWLREDRPLELVLFARSKGYVALIDAFAAAEPRLKPYLDSVKSGTGFTLYPARIAVYFHDPKVQQEARPDHSVAHNAAHLEMYRRFGFTPLWLAEGVATAVEEQALGAVYANWYRDGFVYATSHGEWRGPASARALQDYDLKRLVRYSARPYDDVGAHAAYAFAVWALESEAASFVKFCRSVQARYDAHPEQGGQYQIPAQDQQALAEQAFGADLETRLHSFWLKPPKAPRSKAPVPLAQNKPQATG